jgi:thaumarchaeosortase
LKNQNTYPATATQTVDQKPKLFSNLSLCFLLLNVLLVCSFVSPFFLLYSADPPLFNFTWKGRAPYVLFLTLFLTELILGWSNLKTQLKLLSLRRTALMAVCLVLPSLYAVGLTVFGWGNIIQALGKTAGVPYLTYSVWYLQTSWLLSVEILLFTAFSACTAWAFYGKNGLKNFSVALFFLGAIGTFYMLDTFYPYGSLSFLQALVPPTTAAASSFLNALGYHTWTFAGGTEGLGLGVSGAGVNQYVATISWSCAGIQSLLIYSFVILLFLKGTSITTQRKIIYVIIGAAGTFLVNILRIAAIFMAGVASGADSAAIFHVYYGELFFIAWIITYFFIVFLCEKIMWTRTQRIR